MSVKIFCVLVIYVFAFVFCGYQPTGDEVQPGSVLLPATRRGRYLANIVRRQAVDGTGIRFNKDADRMNAEAKKKVDVLSEELLPYIIAEQERRTTLYKRIMTAIQNGEKGVTIAEIRNKPALIIRKGLLYRCPTNRPPREPDGSGILLCEDDIEPTQVMYDSCLSAEDKELYVAENKYFFCNRHKIEGPDLPRNGSTVIGCAPIERTSLNYTTSKCALEDTDDVVVHYRYYPDRTYKFVTELDPDREVCDHWNPCQIGYIFSLPSQDQALAASELWHDYDERNEDYQRDEIVPPIAEDSKEEYVHPTSKEYKSSTKKFIVPEGHTFTGVDHVKKDKSRRHGGIVNLDTSLYDAKVSRCGRFVKLTLHFPVWSNDYYGVYRALTTKNSTNGRYAYNFLSLIRSTVKVEPRSMEVFRGQRLNSTTVPYRCKRCRVDSVVLRTVDSSVHTLDTSKYRVRDYTDREGKRQYLLEIEVDGTTSQDIGDYFVNMVNEDGLEEKLRVLTVLSPEIDTSNAISISRLTGAYEVGKSVENTISYSCEGCALSDVLCNGESLLSTDKVTITAAKNTITFNFPRFEDNDSCVYMGAFKENGTMLMKVLAVIENSSPAVTLPQLEIINPPNEGEQFEYEVPYNCNGCIVEKVYVNGIPLENSFRRNSVGSIAFYLVTPTAITIRITEYTSTYEGVYQAVFVVDEEKITKTIMEIHFGPEEQPDDKFVVSSEDSVSDSYYRFSIVVTESQTQEKTSSTEATDTPNETTSSTEATDTPNETTSSTKVTDTPKETTSSTEVTDTPKETTSPTETTVATNEKNK